jgi:hypothetical protein
MNTINFLNKHFSDPTGTACTQCKKVHRSLELSCACLRRTVGQRWESMFRRKRKRAVAVLIYRPFIRDSVNTNYAASRAPSQKKMQPSPILTLVTEVHYPSVEAVPALGSQQTPGDGSKSSAVAQCRGAQYVNLDHHPTLRPIENRWMRLIDTVTCYIV